MRKFKSIEVNDVRLLSFKKTIELPANMHRIVGFISFILPDDITGYEENLGGGFDNLGYITLRTLKGNLIENYPVSLTRIFEFDIDTGLHVITRKLNMLGHDDIVPIIVDDLYKNDELTIIFDSVSSIPNEVSDAIGANNYKLEVILEYE